MTSNAFRGLDPLVGPLCHVAPQLDPVGGQFRPRFAPRLYLIDLVLVRPVHRVAAHGTAVAQVWIHVIVLGRPRASVQHAIEVLVGTPRGQSAQRAAHVPHGASCVETKHAKWVHVSRTAVDATPSPPIRLGASHCAVVPRPIHRSRWSCSLSGTQGSHRMHFILAHQAQSSAMDGTIHFQVSFGGHGKRPMGQGRGVGPSVQRDD